MKAIQMLTLALIAGLMTMHVVAQQHVQKGYGVPVTQTEPQFPGGDDSLKAFIQKNLKYPPALIASRTGGSVQIMFLVDKDGSIVDPIILKGINPEINEEALRVVKSMPKWTPGKTGSMPVNKQYVLPIDFAPPTL